jgi:ABC-type transport system substrate-binding protein
MEGTSARACFGRGPLGMLAVLFALLLLLVGCSPVTPGESARARQATSGPSGSMTFQLPTPPGAFDPFAAPDTADFLLAAAHFQPLVAAVEGRVLPRMAVFWGSTDDGRGVRVQLKHDRWSDEERMASTDLIFTIEQHLRPGSRSPLLPALLRISGAQEFHEGRSQFVDGLVAESARTVAITLIDPDPNYIAQLTGLLVLPAHIYTGRDLGDPQTFREPDVGSGAYLFSAWSDDGTVTLMPNPRVKPFTRLDRVVGRYVPPTEVVDALERGSLDFATAIPGRDLDSVPATHRAVTAPGDRLIGLSGRGPLADVRVRQAVAYALDRPGLLDRYLDGRGRVSDSVMFLPDWATSPRRAAYPHDPARARALLIEAGWDTATEIRLVVLTADTDRALWDEVIRQLATAGMRATITVRPVTDRSAVWGDPAVDGVIDTLPMPVPDPALVEPWVSCGSVSGYCNPGLDELLTEGRAETSPTERQAIYQEADRILSVELPVVPLWVPDAAVVVVNGRGGVNALLQPSTAMIDFWGPA